MTYNKIIAVTEDVFSEKKDVSAEKPTASGTLVERRKLVMLGNVNKELLVAVLIAVLVIAVVIIVGGVVLAIVKAVKNKSYGVLKNIFFTIGAVIIMAASWVLNMGWLRFFMTFLATPLIHAIAFFLTNFFSAKHFEKSKKLKILNVLFFITYLSAYLLLPDGGDIGEMYFFFGLVQNNTLSDIAFLLSSIAFEGQVVLFIMQIVEIKKIKKAREEKREIPKMPEWDEIVEMLHDKGLDCFDDEVVKVIYSKDGEKRYVVWKDDEGLFTYRLQKIYQLDEDEWNYRCGYDPTPAFWQDVHNEHISVFASLDEALKEMEKEAEYKTFALDTTEA